MFLALLILPIAHLIQHNTRSKTSFNMYLKSKNVPTINGTNLPIEIEKLVDLPTEHLAGGVKPPHPLAVGACKNAFPNRFIQENVDFEALVSRDLFFWGCEAIIYEKLIKL